jgi:hypothetical protein
MQWLLIVLLSLHVVPGVFWAGSTFVLARSAGAGAEQLVRPQLGAATVSIIAGIILWGLLHRAGFGTFEFVLALGVVCAIGAAGFQSGMVLPAVRRLHLSNESVTKMLRGRIAQGERLSSLLLAITVIAMVSARYV